MRGANAYHEFEKERRLQKQSAADTSGGSSGSEEGGDGAGPGKGAGGSGNGSSGKPNGAEKGEIPKTESKQPQPRNSAQDAAKLNSEEKFREPASPIIKLLRDITKMLERLGMEEKPIVFDHPTTRG